MYALYAGDWGDPDPLGVPIITAGTQTLGNVG